MPFLRQGGAKLSRDLLDILELVNLKYFFYRMYITNKILKMINPISSSSYTDVNFYFRAADDNYFIAQGNDSRIYRFDYISGPEPIVVDIIENPTSVANFGNVIAFNGIFLIASGTVGQLYTYYCNEICTAGRVIKTGANSDPLSLVSDTSSFFYAAYPQYNYTQEAGVAVIKCDEEEGCRIISSLQSFIEDCVNSFYPPGGCFKYGYIGYKIELSSSFNALLIGFPDANNGRGVVLLYQCFDGYCGNVQEIINPNNFTGGALMTNTGFGSAVSISYDYLLFSYYISIGIPGAVSSVLNGQSVANLRTGGAYIYSCSTVSIASILTCSLVNTNIINNDIAQCRYYDQNYGSFISSSIISELSPNIRYFISSPSSCQETGVIWITDCDIFNCNLYQEVQGYSTDNYNGQSIVSIGSSFFYNSEERGYYASIPIGSSI